MHFVRKQNTAFILRYIFKYLHFVVLNATRPIVIIYTLRDRSGLRSFPSTPTQDIYKRATVKILFNFYCFQVES